MPPPRVLGVDDWAWRKGCSYGTILCDLERRRVIDLLPDRKAETLAAWLKRHPSIAVVVRDRSGAYADGARHGAPQAIQIADRWHLLCNGSAALRELLDHHHRDLRDTAQAVAARMAEDPPAQETTPVEPESPAEDPALTRAQARSLASRQRRQARFEEAVRLREQGLSMRATARTLGIERKTVRRWLRAGQAPTWRRAHRGRSILDPFRPYLDRRWNEGCHNAAALWRELHEQGFPGGPSIVRQWATCQRQTEPAAAHPRPRVAPPPTSRKAARMLMADPDTLSNDDRRFVAVLRERSAPIARAADLMQRYAALAKGGSAGPLDGWITEAEVGGFPGFAASLRQDYDAVQTALSEPWSTGQVEGQINRLKVIKRAMYGRAGFELLRSRVLAAA